MRWKNFCSLPLAILSLTLLMATVSPTQAEEPSSSKQTDTKLALKIQWEKNYLTIFGDQLPGEEMRVLYLEAYCRAGSTDRVWGETTIGHTTKLISASKDQQRIELQCTLADGVKVDHLITVVPDGIDFRLTAHNPTKKHSEADWAQPCVRVGKFSGRTQQTYLPKSFVFLDGKLARMPTANWATKARYIPGQVWCPKGVNRNDVNPRPLSENVTSNGLIGCFSADESMIYATAWEPYQELFQGVIVCLHSDFRIGGLKPGETKKIRGKIYLMRNDVPKLLKQYEKDFPEHVSVK